MTTRIKLRRDTAANWTLANPILAAGEPGLETDTGKVKYGDGVTDWNVLEHSGGDILTNKGAITVQTGDDDRWFVRLRREDQTENPDWAGVVVTSTNYDSEGNAIVAAKLNLQDDGVVIAKFTPAGELVWKKSVGQVNGSYYLESNVVIDSDDNIIFAVNPDDSQVKYIIKMNGVTGAIMFCESFDWNYTFRVKAIAVDSNDNIIIGGNFYYDSSDEDVGFVAKLNPTATSIIWQRSLMVDSGGSDINTLEVDFNNNIIAAGNAEVEHTVDGNTVSDYVMLVAKITSTGGLGWQKSISLDDINQGAVTGISLDSVGNIYATGSYWVNTGNQQFYGGQKSNAIVIFKMTTQGVVVWDRRVGPGECSWVGVSTAVGSDGDLYLYASTYQWRPAGDVNSSNGYWNATLCLARYNKATGAVIWQSYFDNPNAQEIPGEGNDAPWSSAATDLMAVMGDKILIGGAVRLGQSGPDQDAPWGEFDYFNQGFLAQFDTESTPWSAEGWTLSTSRIPGKLTSTLTAVDGSISLQTGDINIGTDGSIMLSALAVGVSTRRTASKTNNWTFGKDGTLSTPADANIKLNQKQLGYATMYGIIPNDNDDIWFESVCHDADGFAYAVGSDWWSDGSAHIYKFTPEGNVVWARQLYSGSGATFYVEWNNDVYTLAQVQNNGYGYKVGDRIVLPGSQMGGTNGVNSLTLEVATIYNNGDYVGGVATVNIIGGVAVGSSDNGGIQDWNDNARCEVRSMTFDPVTGNPVVIITTPTFNGDTFDNEWTETVLLLIDSGSGTVVSTTTLRDEGDVYAYDTDVSVTGKVAVVGQKFNEYEEYGAITPLAGSSVDKLWVAKADIDAEHYPGEPNGNWYDWWITGSTIADQVQVQSVNLYSGVTNAVRQGSGATFDVTIAGDGSITNPVAVANGGTNYLQGHKIKIPYTAIGGSDANSDIILTVTGATNGVITSVAAGFYGGGAGTANTYYAQTGTNYQTATGNPITLLSFNPTTGNYDYYNNTTAGTSYFVEGDVITVSGTQFAGGSSPANDIVFTVASVNNGAPTSFNWVSGSIPSTYLLITTDDSVDYLEVGATFAIKQNLGGEAFIWTPDFNKAIGSNNSDWFSGVVWNAAGTHLYAVGSGRYEVNYNQALVVKFSSTGSVVSSKYINDDMDGNSSYNGAVALMANDCIVVVHEQYNPYRDQTDEVLVTKLDSSLNIIWQQFIGVDSTDGWTDPDGNISVAVDPATDEILIAWEATDYSDIINDDAIHLIKLDTDGEVLWKRIFGIHESDAGICYSSNGNKALSIHGDQFTLVGYTDGPDDDTDNAFIVTLPLDGTGVGLQGLWTYEELNDDRIKVWRLDDRTSTAFTPTVQTNGITAVNNLKYYYTNYQEEEFTFYPQVIRSNEGGALEFADGSKQTFSTAIVPQVKISAGRYTIRPEDSGRHILVEMQNYNIVIPSWKKVTLPVGFTFTIVNISGNTLTVENENQDGRMWFSGGDDKTAFVGIADNGSGQMVTLMKVKEGTYSDDGEDHGDIWMIAGANISNNW